MVDYYHQELNDAMVPRPALYKGQAEWVKAKDYDRAVAALREIANRPSVGCQCGENSGLNSTEVNIARAALDALVVSGRVS